MKILRPSYSDLYNYTYTTIQIINLIYKTRFRMRVLIINVSEKKPQFISHHYETFICKINIEIDQNKVILFFNLNHKSQSVFFSYTFSHHFCYSNSLRELL